MQLSFPTEIQTINKDIFTSSSWVMADIISKWPEILTAIGLILIGFIIMKLLTYTIIKISSKIFLHKFSAKSWLTKFLKRAQIKSKPSEVIAKVIGGYIFMTFFLAAANVLDLTDISEFLNKVIRYIPKVIVSLFIVLIGTQLADTVSAITESTLNIMKSHSAKLLWMFAKVMIILFAILTALFQLNIAEELVEIIFIWVVAMLSLSWWLAFWLWSKDFVKDLLNNFNKKQKWNS